ncbi:MAG: hypothetical protein JXX28_14115 [Deltaproteobacteria bacterium]|nr:hypothetical protein [Deltaproteobacteria bacterium]
MSRCVLDAGLVFSVQKGSVVLLYDGDLVVDEPPAGVGRIAVSGDLTLRGDLPDTDLIAGGTLRVEGGAVVRSLRAAEVVLAGGRVVAQRVQGERLIQLRDARLEIDVMVAPEVRVQDGVGGRVTVLQSRGEVAHAGIRGCLSFEDYEGLFGDLRSFLLDRGVPLHEVGPCLPAAALRDARPAVAGPVYTPPALHLRGLAEEVELPPDDETEELGGELEILNDEALPGGGAFALPVRWESSQEEVWEVS